MDLLWHVLMEEQREKDVMTLIVTIAWEILLSRNEATHGGVIKTGPNVVQWCKQYLEEYWEANPTIQSSDTDRSARWVPRVAPLFKINVDGMVFVPQRVVGVGVIIYNEEGEVIAALSKKIKVPLGAFEAEAKGL